MATLNNFLHYFGGITLALLFLFGTKNYAISLIAGFIAFCIFYFSFGIDNFNWQLSIISSAVKDASIVYVISFIIGFIIYKIFPVKTFDESSNK